MPSRLARRAFAVEDDEVGDDAKGSGPSDASSDDDENARRDRDASLSENDVVPRPQFVNGSMKSARSENRENGGSSAPDKFQPGAIVRVKLTDFVTYSSAEFYPGPSLNMVIGPNGTGKSSLVCAICLGLGWPPKILGRGGEVGEFVKHNCNYADVEIELQGKSDKPQDNYVVGLRIIKDGNGREWKLNGRKTTYKAVQELMKSLHIQIDNLCQFLPQDKVAAFAAMDPVALLDATQRAACPEQMLEWHEELKAYRKEQKGLQDSLEQDKEQLQGNESRLATMRADADKLEEINAVKVRVARLEKTIPFIEYKERRLEWLQQKAQKAEAVRNLEALEALVAPTLASIEHKKDYAEKISQGVDHCKKSLSIAEKAADTTLNEITKLDENIKEFEQQAQAERDSQKPRRKDILKFRDQIRKAEEALKDPPKEFFSADWNDQIRSIQREVREVDSNFADLKSKYAEAADRGRVLRAGMDEIEQELNGLNTQEGQQMTKIDSINKEVGTAWKWIQKHRHEFEKEVYGPPLIECSIKDPRYTAAVEAFLSPQDLLCFTTQTPADDAKLNHALLSGDGLALADITIRNVNDNLADQHPPLSPHEMRQFGLDGWALDYIDGPAPVLAMLCAANKIHRSGIALASISEEQHNSLVNSNCNSWITGKHFYKVSRRAEYGPQATSTATKGLQDARFWVDAPINTSAKQELETKREALQAEFETLKESVGILKKDMAALKQDAADLRLKQTQKEDEKKAVQTAWGHFVTLPNKIAKDKVTLAAKEAELEGLKQQIEKIYVNQDNTVIIRKAAKVLDYKKKVEAIRKCHTELLEATIRLIEAQSDVESLTERNIETMQRVERERTIARESEEAFKIARAKAKIAINAVNQIKREAEDAADGSAEFLLSDEVAPEGMTVEIRESEIRAEQNKLSFMHAGNPHAIEAYEAFKVRITKLQDKINSAESTLVNLEGSIAEIRGKWEPQLDRVIKEISDAFAYNFEQIGCAGEVGVRKDEDFEKWEIQIKVKFRATETLQILDQHRQSGGERSVSTIFYLMALQSLAKSPFRVVDEINQGMDPRNERMVHERMVDIACKEHTSQYFLITPKLLTGLRYDKRMKVHCIASGEFMPPDYKKLDARRIINLRRAMMAQG